MMPNELTEMQQTESERAEGVRIVELAELKPQPKGKFRLTQRERHVLKFWTGLSEEEINDIEQDLNEP